MGNINELNKKLAKWAGIRYEYVDVFGEMRWVYPTGETAPELYDFTQDETACFKRLVPKLHFWEIRNYKPFVVTYLKPRARVSVKNPTTPYSWLHAEAEAETPALALCNAILKLIDNGEK